MNPVLKRALGARWPSSRQEFSKRDMLAALSASGPAPWTTKDVRAAILARIEEISALLSLYVKLRHRDHLAGRPEVDFGRDLQTRMCDVIENVMNTLE
jgi:hypothetical protein